MLRHDGGNAAAGGRAPRHGAALRPAALACALLLALLGPAAAQEIDVTVPTLCILLARGNLFLGNDNACGYVDGFMKTVMSAPVNVCGAPNSTEYGEQTQPITKPATNLPPKIQAKTAPQPLSNRGSPQYFTGRKLTKVLQNEAATYLWHWQTIRNIKYFYPCSKDFNGTLKGYLVPEGWTPVGGTTKPGSTAPINPGLYNWVQDGTSYPMIAVLKQDSSKHLVFAVRGSCSATDWKTNLYYKRVGDFKFTGEAFPDNAFTGATIHEGYAGAFAKLWPDVQAVLKEQVVSADKKAAPKSITFSGHSLGGNMAQLLGFAAKKYLKASKKGSVQVGVITIGSPALGDTAFVKSLKKLATVRRLVFSNDLYNVLPCNSSVDADTSTAMPACPKAVVPTANPAGIDHWPDYQQAFGGIYFTADDMPVQKDAWEAIKAVDLTNSYNLYKNAYSGHVCAYVCYLRQFVAAPDNNDMCLLSGSDASHSLCSGIGG